MTLDETIAEVLRLDSIVGEMTIDPDLQRRDWEERQPHAAAGCVTINRKGRRYPASAHDLTCDEAILIAHYRTACPDLAREVTRLRAALTALKDHLEHDGGATCDIMTMHGIIVEALNPKETS